MPEGKTGKPVATRGQTASLFRPGKTVALPPITLDIVKSREIFRAPSMPNRMNAAKAWESLTAVQLSAQHLAGNGLFPSVSTHPAAVAIDQLRSKVLHGLEQKGWKRIAITSPTHGCGKSFVATNLALSLARRPSSRTVLVDLDLRRPHLAELLGVTDAGHLEDFLTGEQPLESVFSRFGRTLALGLNNAPVDMAAELLHSPDAVQAMAAMVEHLSPEVVICDMPPALGTDDLLAAAPALDAVLLVVDGTKTSPAEIRACERLFAGRLPLLGVVLNRAQGRDASRHAYGKV